MSPDASRKGGAGAATFRGNSLTNLDDPRDRLIYNFANEISMCVVPWIRVALRRCGQDYLCDAVQAVLEESTNPRCDMPSSTLIRLYRSQIAAALVQMWCSDWSPQPISVHLWEILQQNGALPSLHGSDQNPPRDPELYSIAHLIQISFTERCLDHLKELSYYRTGAILQAIEDEILDSVDSSKDINIVISIHGWDIVDFMKDQYENNQSLDKVLLIVGTSKQAYVAPYWQYVSNILNPRPRHRWLSEDLSEVPGFAEVSEALSIALKEGKFSITSRLKFRLYLY